MSSQTPDSTPVTTKELLVKAIVNKFTKRIPWKSPPGIPSSCWEGTYGTEEDLDGGVSHLDEDTENAVMALVDEDILSEFYMIPISKYLSDTFSDDQLQHYLTNFQKDKGKQQQQQQDDRQTRAGMIARLACEIIYEASDSPVPQIFTFVEFFYEMGIQQLDEEAKKVDIIIDWTKERKIHVISRIVEKYFEDILEPIGDE